MDAEKFAAVLVVALGGAVAAGLTIRKQRSIDEADANRRWELWAVHLEQERARLEAENAVYRRQRTEDAVTIALYEDRIKRLKEGRHEHARGGESVPKHPDDTRLDSSYPLVPFAPTDKS